MSDSHNQFRENIKKLKKHKTAMLAFYLLIGLYLSAILAPVIAPYNYKTEARKLSYCPPSKVYFSDKGKFSWPFVYKQSFSFDKYYSRIYIEDKTHKFYLKFFIKGDSYSFFGLFNSDRHLFGVDNPAKLYLFGADSRGRDLLSRILYGGQISLSIGFIGVFISLLIGLFVGGISGYFGSTTDTLLMRLCEIIMVIPGFYLMLSLRTIFSYSMNSIQMYFVIVCIMSFLGWPGLARVIRGMAISLREREFVLAAQALGVSNIKIIWRHILPHTFSYVVVSVSLAVPGFILGESALSMLGLGIQDPYASWGNLLAESMAVSQIKLHPWVLVPGIFIFVTVMAFNLLGDGLRDAFDPKLKSE